MIVAPLLTDDDAPSQMGEVRPRQNNRHKFYSPTYSTSLYGRP